MNDVSEKVRHSEFGHVNPAMSMDSLSTVGDTRGRSTAKRFLPSANRTWPPICAAPTYKRGNREPFVVVVGRGYVPDGQRRILLHHIVRVP